MSGTALPKGNDFLYFPGLASGESLPGIIALLWLLVL